MPCLSLLVFNGTVNAEPAAAGTASFNQHRHAPWQSIGPSPPAILAPIAADAKSHTIYVGSAGAGVMKSTDGGATFRAVNNGLVALTITGLALSPRNPNIVYANTQFDGLFKTVDGGAHWTGGDWAGLNLFMDPNNSDIMYGASGPFDYLLKTTDGGKTWVYAADGLGTQGLLREIGPWSWHTGDGFHLVWSGSVAISPHAELIRDRIIGRAEAGDSSNVGPNDPA